MQYWEIGIRGRDLITRVKEGSPDIASVVYKKSAPRFRTRIGELVGAMFGFYNWETTAHPAGAEIYEYCLKESINPKQLWMSWVENCACLRCAERFMYRIYEPKCNLVSPPYCRQHEAGLEGLTAFEEG